MKQAKEVREEFLEFFRKKEHKIVPSSPVIPQDDPTLLFTNAGMNQFKDVFLGTGTREYKRAANTQKCIRVSGKHNDLEEVGWDTYHHTFFEMLGNWSFGDYFKKEAIEWAWELLVDWWRLPKERLYATVFAGDEEWGLPPDEESEEIWQNLVGLPKERVLRFGKKDNFWEMGDTGPCGPCTEIHLDRGEEGCEKRGEKGHRCQVNGGCGRFIEIWNLVFIQFNRREDGSLEVLPAKHVDTGMGFERIVAVLQGKLSNYDTDLFAPIFSRLSEIVKKDYGREFYTDVSFRVIADHVRALSFAFADGALPGNTGRGYVLRRLLRRAARYGRQYLGMEEPFIYLLVEPVASIYREVFPEVWERREHIQLLVKSEEESFGRTIDKGIRLFEEEVQKLAEKKKKVFPGDLAYRMFSTYGFPKDLIELMAREKGMGLDEKGWKKAEEEHKKQSEGKIGFDFDVSELEGLPATEFTGYNRDETGRKVRAKVLKLIGTERLVLDKTPFYAESGGQVGDTGRIYAKGFSFRVLDTQKYGDVIVHIGELEEGDLTRLPEEVTAEIDYERRKAIMANHTATHLLHKALKELFGESANQAGSLVAPDRLRFDVTLPRRIKKEELEELERRVNAKIVEDIPLRTEVMPLEEAKKLGAMALFGEKYGEVVRVVMIDDYSKELCGGTHCASTGEIGAFVITYEGALQAGVRRIEAVTREAAIQYIQRRRATLERLAQRLNVPLEQVEERVEKLLVELKEWKKKGERTLQVEVSEKAKELWEKAKKKGNVRIITASLEGLKAKDLQMLADQLLGRGAPVAGVLASKGNGKVHLLAVLSKELLRDDFDARTLLAEVAKIVGGRGGGRPDRAQGGGTKPEKLKEALQKAEEILMSRM